MSYGKRGQDIKNTIFPEKKEVREFQPPKLPLQADTLSVTLGDARRERPLTDEDGRKRSRSNRDETT